MRKLKKPGNVKSPLLRRASLLAVTITTIAALTLSSCAPLQRLQHDSLAFSSAAGLTSAYEVERGSRWVLPRNTSFYVALDPQSATDFSALLSAALGEQMTRHFPRVLHAEQPESIFEARSTARQYAINYVLYPQLLVWEDSASTWRALGDSLRLRGNGELLSSVGPDRTRLQLTLLEAGSGHVVDVSTITARSGALTLHQHPEDLLLEIIGRYVDSLAP